jgi:glycosyltransferase involved in cell wall biosynthesis
MKILHTEASPGWGGQEIRILREAEGMRARGHTLIFALQKGGRLAEVARAAGFCVYELNFKKSRLPYLFIALFRLISKHQIEVVNTHSSLDAWSAGVVGRLRGCGVVRTRHLSTPVRKGLNSWLLYNVLAGRVVTTCEETVALIRKQAHLPEERCRSVPTGVDARLLVVEEGTALKFREQYGIKQEECLVGTLCVLRGWKGVSVLLKAAALLRHLSNLKWLIVGSGPSEEFFRQQWSELQLEERVIFTGHLNPPYAALSALDVFLLLSYAHEGVSQASLQAAFLEKPLITTSVGGLKEVCLHGKTGLQVAVDSPKEVADAVVKFYESKELRQQLGKNAKQHVERHFSYLRMLDQMEKIYDESKGRRRIF